MGVIVDRDAVRVGGDHPIEGVFETYQRLLRQTVDQVDIHRSEIVASRRVDYFQGLGLVLDAVHRTPHLRIEVLYAEAPAIETVLAQAGDISRISGARVELDRVFAVDVEVEMTAQLRGQFRNLIEREKIGRAA